MIHPYIPSPLYHGFGAKRRYVAPRVWLGTGFQMRHRDATWTVRVI